MWQVSCGLGSQISKGHWCADSFLSRAPWRHVLDSMASEEEDRKPSLLLLRCPSPERRMQRRPRTAKQEVPAAQPSLPWAELPKGGKFEMNRRLKP